MENASFAATGVAFVACFSLLFLRLEGFCGVLLAWLMAPSDSHRVRSPAGRRQCVVERVGQFISSQANSPQDYFQKNAAMWRKGRQMQEPKHIAASCSFQYRIKLKLLRAMAGGQQG